MAGEPKRRHSKARKRTRRASINLSLNFVNCKNCGKPQVSHTVCRECGFYGGQEVKGQKKVEVIKA